MIGPMREWRAGWAVQTVKLLARDARGYEARRQRCRSSEASASVGLQRGYVKLWRKVCGEWQVVDRALTQKRAKAMARDILRSEAGHAR